MPYVSSNSKTPRIFSTRVSIHFTVPFDIVTFSIGGKDSASLKEAAFRESVPHLMSAFIFSVSRPVMENFRASLWSKRRGRNSGATAAFFMLNDASPGSAEWTIIFLNTSERGGRYSKVPIITGSLSISESLVSKYFLASVIRRFSLDSYQRIAEERSNNNKNIVSLTDLGMVRSISRRSKANKEGGCRLCFRRTWDAVACLPVGLPTEGR